MYELTHILEMTHCTEPTCSPQPQLEYLDRNACERNEKHDM